MTSGAFKFQAVDGATFRIVERLLSTIKFY